MDEDNIDVFLKKIYELLSKYFHEYTQVNLDKQKISNKKVETLLLTYSNLLEQKTYNVDYFIYLSNINTYTILISEIMDMLDNTHITDIDIISSELSGTYLFNIIKLYDNTVNKVDKILNENIEDIITNLIEKSAETLLKDLDTSIESNNHANVMSIYDNIHSSWKLYPNTIKLYSNLTQSIIDKLYKTYKDEWKIFIQKIMDIVELDKTEIMKIPSKDKKDTCNPPYKRFNLVPSRPVLPLDQIIKLIFNIDMKINQECQLDSVADAKQCSFLVINNIINKPIHFDIWNLTNYNVSKDLVEDENTGVNNNIIKRFNTIQILSDYVDKNICHKNTNISRTKKRFLWSYKLYSGTKKVIDDNILFYILETLDGVHYQILTLHETNKNFGLPKSKITCLLNYIKNKTYTTDRICVVNKFLEKKGLSNMFLKGKVDVNKLSNLSMIFESSTIRHDIYSRIIEWYDNRNIKKISELIALITSEDLKIFVEDTYMNIFIEYYSKKNKDISRFNEVCVTFLQDVSYTCKQFRRLLINFNNEFSTEYKNKLITKISIDKYFQNLIQEVLQNIISNKSNIYQSVLFKESLINLPYISV